VQFSDYERLRFERRGHGVLLITMDRPEVYNAADEQMHGELARVWTDVSADPQTRVATAAIAEKRPPRFPSAQETPGVSP
jgi:enoyl-CoA hydratase